MGFLILECSYLAGDVQKIVEGDWLSLFFVDRTSLKDWVVCPLKESTEEGQYFATLERVRLGHEAKLTAWMAEIQVDFTGKTEAAWR